MIRWKFKTFIILYAAICIGIIIYGCNYVWNGLAGYQRDYDKEMAMSDPDLVMDQFMKSFDMGYIEQTVKSESSIYLTEFEDAESVLSLYRKDFADAAFKYQLQEEYSNNEKKVYSILTDKDMEFVTVIVTKEGRTKNFGFTTWKIEEIVLDKYYDAVHKVIIRVPEDSTIIVNGQKVIDKSKYEADQADEFDQIFSKELGKFGVTYKKYKYYKFSNLYQEPKIEVMDGGNVLTAALNNQGIYDYESLADEAYKASVIDYIYQLERLYGDYVSKYVNFEDIQPYLVEGTEFYNQTEKAWSLIQFNTRPRSTDYYNWNISNLKQYGENMFSCDIIYTQKVVYPGKSREYDNQMRALFKLENGIWKIAYQKNK